MDREGIWRRRGKRWRGGSRVGLYDSHVTKPSRTVCVCGYNVCTSLSCSYNLSPLFLLVLFLIILVQSFKPDTVNKTVTRGREGERERESRSRPRSQTRDISITAGHIFVLFYLVLTLFQPKHTASSIMEPAAPINSYESDPRHDRMR